MIYSSSPCIIKIYYRGVFHILRLAILDDDPTVPESIKSLIETKIQKTYEISTYNYASELMRGIGDGTRLDILIADVRLADGDGIEVVKRLQSENRNLKVIYLSGFPDSCTRIFETEPCYYLQKPLELSRLKAALNKAENLIAAGRKTVLFQSDTGAALRLYESDIRYIESHGRKLTIHIKDKSREPYEIYKKLDDAEKLLGNSFCRCHKSYLVNMEEIMKINGSKVLLFDKTELFISRARTEETKRKFAKFLGGKL